jgi:phosphoribosylformylglycinamidine synthase
MKYKAAIDIMPLKDLLDPQGKTVAKNLKNIEISGIEDVRIGKHVEMVFEAGDENEANSMVDSACKKLLANVIMETYSFKLSSLN